MSAIAKSCAITAIPSTKARPIESPVETGELSLSDFEDSNSLNLVTAW